MQEEPAPPGDSLDPEPEAYDVTGDWVGDYSQHDRRSPIQAVLQQTGQELTGTMTDLRTVSDQSLFEAAAEAGLPPGSDERIDEQVRRLLQATDKEPVRAGLSCPNSRRCRAGCGAAPSASPSGIRDSTSWVTRWGSGALPR